MIICDYKHYQHRNVVRHELLLLPPVQCLIDDGLHHVTSLVQLLIPRFLIVPDELYDLLGAHHVPEAVRRYHHKFHDDGVYRVHVDIRCRGHHKISTAGAEGPKVTERTRDTEKRDQVNLFIATVGVLPASLPDHPWNSFPANHNFPTCK